MNSSKPVCVTGCSGYIGQALVRRLAEQGRRVLGVDRAEPPGDLPLAAFTRTDMAEPDQSGLLGQALQGSCTLFHLAAARTDWGLDYEGYYRDNVAVTDNLVQAAREAGVGRWVYFGTVGVYGPSEAPLDEASPFAPTTDYGATKAEAERRLLAAAQEEGWTVRSLRPSAVFSEGQPPNTNLYRLIEAIRRNRFVLIGDGSEVKTTSYLHNTVDAALWLEDHLAFGGIEAFNIIDEPRLTTRQMVDLIRADLGSRLPLVRLPLGWVEPPARILDRVSNWLGKDLPITSARIRKFCTATNFDGSRICAAGFRPRFTSREALGRTVAWHKEP